MILIEIRIKPEELPNESEDWTEKDIIKADSVKPIIQKLFIDNASADAFLRKYKMANNAKWGENFLLKYETARLDFEMREEE